MVAGLATVLGVWMSATAPTSVLVSEVAYDIVGSEPDGEWVELINLADAPVLLDELRLADEESLGGSEAVLAFPPGTTLGPWQVVVVAVSAAAFDIAHGALPDFEIKSTVATVAHLTADRSLGGSQFQLANSTDEVLLLDSAGLLVDGVSWGRTAPMPGVANAATTTEGKTLVRTFDVGGPPRPWGVGTASPWDAPVIGLNAANPGQTGDGGSGTTDPPVDPDPVDPDPVDPVDPVDPDPVDPAPVDPDPVDPVDPDPVDPVEPEPVPLESDSGTGIDLGAGRGGYSGPITPEADGGCTSMSLSSASTSLLPLALLALRRRRRH
jgi:hypothetical protein